MVTNLPPFYFSGKFVHFIKVTVLPALQPTTLALHASMSSHKTMFRLQIIVSRKEIKVLYLTGCFQMKTLVSICTEYTSTDCTTAILKLLSKNFSNTKHGQHRQQGSPPPRSKRQLL